MISIKIKQNQVTPLLIQLQANINNKNEILKIGARIAREQTEKAFNEEKDPVTGKKWKLTKRKKKKPGSKMLVDSEALINEVTNISNYAIQNQTMQLITNVNEEGFYYGAYHHDIRRFTGFSKTALKKYADTTKEYLIKNNVDSTN